MTSPIHRVIPGLAQAIHTLRASSLELDTLLYEAAPALPSRPAHPRAADPAPHARHHLIEDMQDASVSFQDCANNAWAAADLARVVGAKDPADLTPSAAWASVLAARTHLRAARELFEDKLGGERLRELQEASARFDGAWDAWLARVNDAAAECARGLLLADDAAWECVTCLMHLKHAWPETPEDYTVGGTLELKARIAQSPPRPPPAAPEPARSFRGP